MADHLPAQALLEWYNSLRVEVAERHAREKYDVEKALRLQRQQWDSVVARGAWEQQQQQRARRKTQPPALVPPPPPQLDRDVLLHIASFLSLDDPLGPMARVWSLDGMTVLRQSALRRKWAVFSQVHWTLPAFQEDELWVHERLIPWGSEYARDKTAREECAMIRIMADQLDVLGRNIGLHGVANNNMAIAALRPVCRCGAVVCVEFLTGGWDWDWDMSPFPDTSIFEWYDSIKQMEAEERERGRESYRMSSRSFYAAVADADRRRAEAEEEQRLAQLRRRAEAEEEQRLAQLAVPRMYSRKTHVKGWRTRQQEGFRISNLARSPPQPRHEKGRKSKPAIGAFKRR